MCGIAGLVHFDGAPIDPQLLTRMGASLEHRGPDDEGIVCRPDAMAAGPRAGLVSRRLSIVDRAGGHQPIANEDGSIWTILNGEIYNFAALRDELTGFGHHFKTRSDTEVIVHGYEQWGTRVVERLDGMFAFAVWDDRRSQIVLARDRFGKKPLVYFDDGRRLGFASELQSLLQIPGIPRDLDPDALGEYLAYMAIPAPRTIYRDVRKLPPAHVLVRKAEGTAVIRYWSLSFEPKATITERDAAAEVERLLTAAVRKRLIGEVPLGAFLSGGVDSSAVVALMAGLSDRPVKTFSIGFDQPEYDELSYAKRVAAQFGCEHTEFVVKPSAVDVLPDVVRHFGEPYADSSAIPTWHLSRLTRQSVTVALSGDGGDEVFAGYGRVLANDLAERWRSVPAPLRRAGERLARTRLLADFGGARATRFATAAAASREARYRAWAGVFSRDLTHDVSRVAADDAAVGSAFDQTAGLDAIDAMLAVDTNFYLPTDLLPKADIASMAHSLEVRSPMLDVPLAEFVARLPTRLKLKRLTTKHLLKKVFAGRLPAQILKRPKRGFAVPLRTWFRGELRGFLRDHLQPSCAARAGVLEQPAIDRLIEAHGKGAADHAHHLWVLLMFELWYRGVRA